MSNQNSMIVSCRWGELRPGLPGTVPFYAYCSDVFLTVPPFALGRESHLDNKLYS